VIKTLPEGIWTGIKCCAQIKELPTGDFPLCASIENNLVKSEEKIMNCLKRLALATALTMVLTATTLADGSNSPSCPNPGEINSPPCSSSQLVTDDTADQNVTTSSEVETLVITTAISALEDMLTIY
jgi:hypothetical protein